VLLLQADVTANSADDKALLKRFKLFGPPGIVFFDKTGTLRVSVSGGGLRTSCEKFLDSLNKALP
jgi:thiol:disulfide interchange protein DsbD